MVKQFNNKELFEFFFHHDLSLPFVAMWNGERTAVFKKGYRTPVTIYTRNCAGELLLDVIGEHHHDPALLVTLQKFFLENYNWHMVFQLYLRYEVGVVFALVSEEEAFEEDN